MDSVSQIALGAAVAIATMGRRTAVWKAALGGAVAGTLPDLDVLIDHGDPIANMVLHRAESHAPFWLTVFSLPFSAVIARLFGEWSIWRRWWLALWLALVTHPLLDAMTIYGTQLALPFSDHPFGVGSVFIIDPLYTLPLIAGTGWALATNGATYGLRANAIGLAIATAYLAWGVGVQKHVERLAYASLASQGVAAQRVLVTPSPFNSLLWVVVAVKDDQYYEGFFSLLDKESLIAFERFDRGTSASGSDVTELKGVSRIAAFSKGFYKLQDSGGQVTVTDLRMGQAPNYSFSFVVAERQNTLVPLTPSRQVGTRPDLDRAMPWLWRRALGQALPPPR
ncbi:metal-dependent hydrolase [Variovorax saccharolyticus]|uniref:metal-dependent hydrolase n=1 Tax=Variovorax saccharolyticus TaxID=3053516 RepID=UPI002575D36A|nr:metal-dependent hydrolase [Variovorax sp. J31P216]MDM0030100.1 metal-dependent hydrolase [Variovorax sp. J31P216]